MYFSKYLWLKVWAHVHFMYVHSAIHKLKNYFFLIIDLEQSIGHPQTKYYQPASVYAPSFFCLSSTVYEL